GGFLLSVVVVSSFSALVGAEAWNSWGWRLPFLFSIVLLAVSIATRMKLSESPVFEKLKKEGGQAANPLKESFNSPAKIVRLLAGLFGVAAGISVIWYLAHFQSLYFLQNALGVEENSALLVVCVGAALNMVMFIAMGWLSDKVGRKTLSIVGYVGALALLFPTFHWIAGAANPQLVQAMKQNPVVLAGDCASPQAQARCAQLGEMLREREVTYDKSDMAGVARPTIMVAGAIIDAGDPGKLDQVLRDAGYDRTQHSLGFASALKVLAGLAVIGLLSALTYGPAAALLVELYPASTRYTSLSIAYNIGTGYFGGFLPLISQYVVTQTGNPFDGLWYAIAVLVLALFVTIVFVPETAGKPLRLT
ncbi:MFS transporter, partial [Sphingobium sp.]|uniref:MFS transporter n=1 Tax=Sphingobium sp. TaxID=1912891 RepID=UPI003B3A58B9